MRFRGTLFAQRGKFGTRVERAFDVEWSEAGVLSAFGDRAPKAKDAQQLWSAAAYREGANRGNAGVLYNHAAVLDRDCCDVGALDETCDWLDAQGLAYVVYTSWSHLLREKIHTDTAKVGPFDCFRVVLPYSRDVLPSEHAAIVSGLYGHELPLDPAHYAQEALGRVVALPSGRERMARPRGWDPTSNQPARGFYVPTPWSVLEVHQGKTLDVDAVMKRPTTPRATAKVLRPYQAPSRTSLGAVGALERALEKLSMGLGRENPEGWRRSTCPSCQDPSPSLTLRANGDGVDIHCHAGCNRKDVLAALGLDGEVFKAPTQLLIGLEEQLQAQEPREAPIPVEQAVERLVVDIREALASREPTVIEYPAGTGKSHASAIVMTEVARAGHRIAYSTQEHSVAHETMMKLPADVRARAVHIHSPLVQVGHDPVCQRAEELKERVFDFGVSLMGDICPKCPHRAECPALAQARARQKAVDDASVVFVSHAGISQVFGLDADGRMKGADLQLIVDEMPGAFEEVECDGDSLKKLAEGVLMPSAHPSAARVVQEIARAWLAGEEPGDVYWALGGSRLGNAVELAREWGRFSIREGARPKPLERALLGAADAVMRLCVHKSEGHKLKGIENPAKGISAMLPNACHEALIQKKGVLLSATPLMAALPGFNVKSVQVKDGAKVRRVMVLRTGRGSKALTKSYWNYDLGAWRRAEKPELGIPWPVVDEALERACREADKYECKNVLFVTFKPVADALRLDTSRCQAGRVKVAHFGAVRGKNDWMEGREHECSVVYCLGAPRFAVLPTLVQLGLVGEAAEQAWVAYAAGELTQAEGRLRLPRRTKPCTVFVEGDVAPLSWSLGLVDEVLEEGDDDIVTESMHQDDVRFWYGYGTGPLDFSIAEGLRLITRMPKGQQLRLVQEMSWEPA